MLDMAKAFDRVWHDGLVLKLIESPLPRRMVAVLRAFLTERTFFIATGEAASRPRPITAGVPQGSVLSPLLYTTYTDDVAVHASPTDHRQPTSPHQARAT
ncbi:unnamed protein product [Pieris brassicae]|uniref:Reverse transcriptase domain-containing protein n=1 Tax=Pieris brassicae TaxID=7116 RepID=A0A9P0THJ9_PIEBR|nr:unnamed protein product [Pieris brassicae]